MADKTPAKTPVAAVKNLLIIVAIMTVLAMVLPMVSDLTWSDDLLPVWASFGWVIACLTVVVLVPVIIYRLLTRQGPVLRIIAAIAAGVVGFFLVFGGSLALNGTICGYMENRCASD